jgi:hypothetical protein
MVDRCLRQAMDAGVDLAIQGMKNDVPRRRPSPG